MYTVALYNLKGGVGKTTAAVNLSYLSSCDARPTLLIDMDPQGSASFFYRVRPSKELTAEIVVNGGKRLQKGIRGSDFPYLDIIPSDISYRNLGKSIREKKHSKSRLRKVFSQFKSEYHVLFIDCPPGISIEAENIFRASDLILLPLIPTPLSLETRELVYTFFRDHGLDESLIVAFFSMADRRKKIHRDILESARETDLRILRSFIPTSSSIEKMGISRKPICAVSKKSVGALAYQELWSEIKCRIDQND